MDETSRTFGKLLQQFALTADNIDDAAFDEVWRLIEEYVRVQLSTVYFALLIEQTVAKKAGLMLSRVTKGNSRVTKGNSESYTLKLEDGQLNGLTSYAYYHNKRLWVVDGEHGPLRLSKNLIDKWSDSSDLPKYGLETTEENKTAIIIPIRGRSKKIGLVAFEALEYIEPTLIALDELRMLAKTIETLYHVRSTDNHLRENTNAAIRNLRVMHEKEAWPQLTQPQLFVASSKNADPEVVGVINSVLDEFAHKVRVILWSNINETGNINLQILEEISKSRFGLCYFSEKSNGVSVPRFRDNPNTIFEAGMMHALTNSPSALPQGWIPVRESDSGPIPFDFAAERILIVDRKSDKSLNLESFEAKLRKRMKVLVGGLGTNLA